MKIEPMERSWANVRLRRDNRKIALELPRERRRINWGPLIGMVLCFLPGWAYLGWHVWRWLGR
jgi:hypothetical protein